MDLNSSGKTKGKYRFNLIDVLLLAVIVLSVGAIIFLSLYDGNKVNSDNETKTVEIIYTVEQKNIPSILRGKISIGDGVTESLTSEGIGQVIDVEYIDSKYTAVDPSTNEMFEAVYPDRIDMRVKISVKATVRDDGLYQVGGCRLNVGEELDVRFPYYMGKTVCISVSEVSE